VKGDALGIGTFSRSRWPMINVIVGQIGNDGMIPASDGSVNIVVGAFVAAWDGREG